MIKRILWLGVLCGALLTACASQSTGTSTLAAAVPGPAASSPAVVSPATPTPFQPLQASPFPAGDLDNASIQPGDVAALSKNEGTADIPDAGLTSPEPSLNFFGIDFESEQRVTIEIIPPDKKVNRGKAIKISFIPAEHCRFGQKTGCVYAYKPSYQGNVIVITVHSGLGGQGQRFRSALEGTGINRAGVSLERVNSNMANLSGAQVRISQGDSQVEASLAALTRIPAVSLKRYFKVDLSEILRVAADLDPEISDLVAPDAPQIVIETCGWKMPGEPGSAGVSDTTGSVYLGIIH